MSVEGLLPGRVAAAPPGRLARVRLLETAGPAAALGLALAATWAAGRYVTRIGAELPSLDEDLLLSVLPRWDWTVLFVWGFAAFLAFAFAAGWSLERRRAPYIVWMYALLVAVRAGFLVLTPMGAPAGSLPVQGYALFDWFGRHLTFGNDLFFSAHTSMPFLGFLVFRTPWVRTVFLGMSVVLAATVLLCRLHYSIDVGAAYFITCGVVWIHRELVESAYRRWKEGFLRCDRHRVPCATRRP